MIEKLKLSDDASRVALAFCYEKGAAGIDDQQITRDNKKHLSVGCFE